MAHFLVIYGTGEGQTAKVADAGTRSRRSTSRRYPADLDVPAYDAVIVGGSIHVGTHRDAVVGFARDHRDALAARPSAFFQVCLSSASDDAARRAEATGYIDAFVEQTGWQLDAVASFAGALRFSEYGFLKRLVMKQIAAEATGDTDTSRDYEYTDWAAVDPFAVEFARSVDDDRCPGAGHRLTPTPDSGRGPRERPTHDQNTQLATGTTADK
ncbi:flavodoxin domain-containing protein [Haloarchaeobius iranensis]|uniref:Menaquinone-dependent protoporphyrinogen oxidase n=1 Tax=Haloarchaeobius iranensis TaxID=996166 RepID=A0A1G9Z1A2_9EURY|nr:flavodoxin domain-containing protein [Haloarchaeobius iranensis]SDN14987.1 menaquinone-dependent protoporphyrinogen oxidase [Haloarchaeobius iranensis]